MTRIFNLHNVFRNNCVFNKLLLINFIFVIVEITANSNSLRSIEQSENDGKRA